MRCCSAFPRAVLCAALGVVLANGAHAGGGSFDLEFSGRIGLEGRWYPESGAHVGQRSHASGFAAESTLFVEDGDGGSFVLTPFFRYDSADARRTHADLREAYVLLFGESGDGEWEARLGIDTVFWGVAESNHLVDIVNQTDLIEHPDEEAKLGQPMVHVTWSGNWGAAELFLLPFHRERTFPGRHGRLRSGLEVDHGRVEYESAARERHVDIAARYTHSFGPLDLGLSVFDGTSREPVLEPAPARPFPDRGGAPAGGGAGPGPVPQALVPHYAQISQLGLDAQLTVESWLFKLEAIHRTGAPSLPDRQRPPGAKDDYAAFVLGGEYTLYSVFESAADLSLLGEWSHDGRGRKSTSKFQNDIFLAAQLALNDIQGTEVAAGLLVDADHVTRTMILEWSRRLSDQWSLHFEAITTLASQETDPVYATRRDSFIGLDLVYHF